MTLWNVDWAASGTAVVEADNADEAESLVTDAVEDFDTLMLEEFQVDFVKITDTDPTDQ